MRQIEWDVAEERAYEDGLDRGVFYPADGTAGVPWNGLVSVSKDVDGGALEELFFDGVKYLDRMLNEDFKATLEAYDAPAEFKAASGRRQIAPGLYASHQARRTFGLSYRTLVGDGKQPAAKDYIINLVWNVTAQPSAKKSGTLSDAPTVTPRSWVLNAVPVDSDVMKPTAHFEVRSDEVDSDKLAALELALYGHVADDDILDGGDVDGSSSEPVIDGGSALASGEDVLDGGTANSSGIDVVDGNPGEGVVIDEGVDVVDGGNATGSGTTVIDGGGPTTDADTPARLPTQAEVIAILS